jgi:hypothetical protein
VRKYLLGLAQNVGRRQGPSKKAPKGKIAQVLVSADTRQKPLFSKGECSMNNNHSLITYVPIRHQTSPSQI